MGRIAKPNRETIETEEQAQRYAIQYADSESRKIRKRPDSQVKAESSEVNSTYLSHNIRLMKLPALTIHSDAAELRERVNTYFTICDQDGMRATIAGLSLALGIDRRRLWEISSGKNTNGIGQETREVISRAYQLINSQIEGMMIAGQSAPIPSIFLLKAQFAYEDTHKIEISSGKFEDEEGRTVEELEKKYRDAIPTDYIEVPDYSGET